MQNSSSDQTTTPVNSTKKISWGRRWSWRCLKLLSLILLLISLFVLWLFQTTSGTRLALDIVERVSLHHLRFEGVEGRLADRLQVAEFQYQDQTESVTIAGLDLEWHPWSLWRGQLEIDHIQASKVQVASKPSTKPVHAPQNLQLPIEVSIKQAALGQLQLADWLNDGSHKKYLSLRAMTAKAHTQSGQYHIQASAISDWGKFEAQGKMAMASPFALDVTGHYAGQAYPDIPPVTADLKFSGSLLELLAQAQIHQQAVSATTMMQSAGKKDPKSGEAVLAQGEVQLQLRTFAAHPLRTVKASITGLDLNHLNQHAPAAVLDVQAQLEAHDFPTPKSSAAAESNTQKSKTGKQASKANSLNKASAVIEVADTKAAQVNEAAAYYLQGKVAIQNAKAKSFDQHGIPFKSVSAAIEWQQNLMRLKDFKLQMQNGEFWGKAQLELHEHRMPILEASLQAEGIDLLQFDSRLRRTQIKGDLQIQTKRARFIDFQVQANDARNRLDGRASFEFNEAGDNGSLHVEKVELQVDQSRFLGQGDISFEGAQKFQVQGNLNQFNPALWTTLPPGKLDSELKVTGSLHPKVALQVQLQQLQGEWDGHRLQGQTRFAWLEDASLTLDQFDLNWGKNSLVASGALGKTSDELRWQLRAQDLRVASNLLGLPFSGKLELDGKLAGGFDALSLTADAKLENFALKQWRLNQAELKLRAAPGPQGKLDADLRAQGIHTASIDLNAPNLGAEPAEKRRSWAEELKFQVKGSRQAHQFEFRTQFDKTHRTELRGEGDLDLRTWSHARWKGLFSQFKLVGFSGTSNRTENVDLQLDSPLNVELATDRVFFGDGQFSGVIGKLKLDQYEWTPSSMQSRGSLDEFRVMQVLNLWKPQHFIAGDLRLGATWDVQLKGNAKAKVELRQQGGDLYLNDADGTGQAMYMGLSDLRLSVNAGGLIAGSDAEKLSIQLNADGKRLGQWQAHLDTELRQANEKWTLDSEAPVSGELHAKLPELQWLAAQLSSEFGLKGALNLDAKLGGKMGKPSYRASVDGKGLELAIASEGLLFPNGELRAELTEKTVKIQQLRFSNKLSFIPKLEQTRDLNWLGQEGEFSASGEINWLENSGAIGMQWKKFPALQRKDRWLVMSGEAQITQKNNLWSLVGKLGADAAYFKLPKLPPPSLSSDVVINQAIKLDPETTELEERKGFRASADMQIDMGPRFVFVGRGLNTALTGTMRMRMNENGSLQASGSIATNGGQYEGYGQQLEIERGILKFQGAPNNPSLNVRALRKGLLVEAGVEVTGNVANPQVRLVSEPNVPDNDKISWLILGREADQLGVNDASLLLTAAGALFGSDGSGNIPKELAKGLGFDEFSIGPAENGGSSKLPSQTIAGETTVGAVNNDNVLNIGWRIKPGLVLSIERGMSDASSALKASWQLGRRVRLVARSGTDQSLDVKYSFSFN